MKSAAACAGEGRAMLICLASLAEAIPSVNKSLQALSLTYLFRTYMWML